MNKLQKHFLLESWTGGWVRILRDRQPTKLLHWLVFRRFPCLLPACTVLLALLIANKLSSPETDTDSIKSHLLCLREAFPMGPEYAEYWFFSS